MTVDEWRAELERLRVLPRRGVRWIEAQGWLDRHRTRPGPVLRPCAREVRRMTPRQRIEMYEGRSLAGAQILRTGRNSWYVVEADRGDGRVRVY
jgi:hypothetical protein